MSRRKQAFPVRIEGSRILSAEPGSSCNQKSNECNSRTILLDECNFSIPAEAAAHLRPPNILSNGELIAADAAYNESKTNVLTHAESYIKNESKTQVILPSIKIDSPIVLNEEQDPLIISPCNSSSFIDKEEDICAFSFGEKKQLEHVIHDQELKPLCLSHNHTHCGCVEVKKNVEMCRDLNVRTSLICETGTEIKIIKNTSLEKVEVHCVTNPTENTFGVRQKPVKHIGESVHENHTPEAKSQRQACTEEGGLESEEPPLEILPCVEVNLSEGPEPLIISSYTDSIPIVQETSLSTFPVGETEQRTRLITTPEPDSNTILLDEYDLNIPANAGYNEPKTCMLTCDEPNFLKNETNPQIILPSAKIELAEPSVILSEEQDSLVIAASSSCIVKREGFCTFGVSEPEQCENVIKKQIEEDVEIYGDIRNSLISKAGTEAETIYSLCAGNEEEQSVKRFTENTVKVCKKQRQKSRRSRKNHAPETVDLNLACTEHENPSDIQDSPLEAILPCVDIDPSLLKEEPEPFLISACKDSIPILKETSISAFPVGDCKEIEQNVETSVDLDVVASLMCDTETETEITPSLCSEKEVGQSTKPTRKSPRVRKKRFQKVRRSRRNTRAPKSTKQRLASAERKKFVKSEESVPEAILPLVDVDPSLLKGEPEPLIISACKDSIPTAAETSLFSFPTRERSRSESKSNTQKIIQMCLQSENSEMSDDSSVNNFDSCISETDTPRKLKPCVTDEEIRCMVDFTKEALDDREKKLQQIREAVYRKRALETDDQRQARLEKDKLRQRKRRAEESEEQREKRLLTMRLHKRIKRSMHSSAGLQKNFLDYYMEEMFKYPETQEEQGSPLNMIVSIDPSWVLRTVEKQQFKCAVETEEQRRTRLEKDMLRQRKKRAEETEEQRAKRLETMRINKRIRRAMETDEQRHRRLEYSRERQLYRRLNETEEQRKERLEREKLRQRIKRASESSEERALRLQAARERMRMRLSDPGKVTDMFDLLSSDSLSS